MQPSSSTGPTNTNVDDYLSTVQLAPGTSNDDDQFMKDYVNRIVSQHKDASDTCRRNCPRLLRMQLTYIVLLENNGNVKQ